MNDFLRVQSSNNLMKYGRETKSNKECVVFCLETHKIQQNYCSLYYFVKVLYLPRSRGLICIRHLIKKAEVMEDILIGRRPQ